MSLAQRLVRLLLAIFGCMVLATWTATVANAAPGPQDAAWMVAAHQSNLTEIAAGQAAQQKATSQAVKDLGGMLITDHTTLDADLTAAAATLGVTLPGAPNPAQQATLTSVGAKSGTAFDSAWITAQLAGHQSSANGTRTETSAGTDATAVKLAQASLPIIEHHLHELQSLAGAPSVVAAGSGGQAAQPQVGGQGTSLAWAGVLAALGVAGLLGAAGVTRRRSA